MVHICVGKSRNMATCRRPKSLQSAVCQQQQQQQKLFAVKERISLNSATVCASLCCYQLAIWKNIFPVTVGTRQRGW